MYRMKNNSRPVPGRKWIIILIIIYVYMMFSTSCGKKKEDRKSSEITIDTTQVLVTDCEGDVFRRNNDDWEEIIDDAILTEADVIKTSPDSSCDLQFGDTALIRVKENTILTIKSVLTEIGRSNINVGLDMGGILCKVRKLTSDEEFHIETKSAVCSVRGTEFGVEVRESNELVLYVGEGACSIIPPELAPYRISPKIKNNPGLEQAILAEIEKNILIVKQNEEAVVNPAAMAKADVYIDELNKKIDEVLRMESIDDASKEKLVSLVSRSMSEAISRGMELKDISKINKNKLEDINTIKTRKVKIESKELKLEKEEDDLKDKESAADEKKGNISGEITSKEDEKGVSGQKDGQASDDKISKDSEKKTVISQQIEVRTTPDKAKVYLNERFIGFSPCTIRKVPPGNHVLRIEKNGYETIRKDIILKENEDAEFLNLILKKKEIEKGKLTIITVPDGASAYLDGEYIGKTPCSVDKLEYGEYLLKLDIRGFAGKTTTIVMDEKQKEIVYPLKPENCEVVEVQQLVKHFGEASNFNLDQLDMLLKKRNQPEPVVLDYFCCFHFFVIEKRLSSILFTGEQRGLFTLNNLRIGSMRPEVLEKLGEPDAILSDRGVFKYGKKGIEIEFREEEVIGIRIFKLDPLLSIEPDRDTSAGADPEIIRFIEMLKAFPVQYGIE